MNGLVKKYSEAGVVFGSYPSWVNNYYKVRLTVEASSPELLDQVEKDVKEEFSVLESYDKFPALNPMEKIRNFLDKSETGLSCTLAIQTMDVSGPGKNVYLIQIRPEYCTQLTNGQNK